MKSHFSAQLASWMWTSIGRDSASRVRRRCRQPLQVIESLECRSLLTIDLLSTTAASTAGGLTSENPQISRDSRFVAFQSRAEDLAITGAMDGNGEQDIFVRNLELGTTSLISVNVSGRSGNGDSWSPSISDDGRFVSFSSFATDLVSGVTWLSGPNAFVHDRDTDKDGIFDEPGESRTYLLSRNGEDASLSGNSASGGIIPGAEYPMRTVISGDGSIVVFGSLATNLLDPADGVLDPFSFPDLYYASPGGEPRLVSVNADGTAAGVYSGGQSARHPSINYSGTRIAFESRDVNLVEDDTEGVADVFVRDLTTGRTRRVSVGQAGGGNDDSFLPVISRDGNHVVFGSHASNLVDGDTNGEEDVFVHDVRTGRTVLISQNRDPLLPGAVGNLASPPSETVAKGAYAISDNGRYVVFTSLATNLLDPVDGISDTNGTQDVFWFDRDADADGIFDERQPDATRTQLVSLNFEGTAATDASIASGGSSAVSISGNGQYVLFTSPGTNLIEGGTAGTAVYLRDMFAGSTSLVGLTGTPGASMAGVTESGLAMNPLRVAFSSAATDLDATVIDSNGAMDVFSYDAPTDIIGGTASGDGLTTITVGFRIANKPAPAPFEVGVYRSADSEFDPADELLDTFMVTGSALEVGRRRLTFSIGDGPGELSLPGAGADETDVDYQILFVFDHLDTIAELDTDPFNGDNASALQGAYHPTGGAIFVHGRSGPGRSGNDGLTVTAPDVNTFSVVFNGRTYVYDAEDITGVRFRGHEGDDFAQTAGTDDLLLGGSGNDKLLAGAGDDLLGGGLGADALFGEAGFDLFYDGMGDDEVDLGPDGGSILATPGSDDVFRSQDNASTIDFSQTDRHITFDLDSVARQQVDLDQNTIQLIGQWVNFVGSPMGTTLRVKPLNMPRTLQGGAGFDQLIIDANGDWASWDGAGLITFGTHGSFSIEGFEDISIANAAHRIIDDSDTVSFAHDGFFDSSPDFPQGFNGGVKFSAAGSGRMATWTFQDLVPGRYTVAATWTNAGDRAKDSPFTIRDGDGNGPVLAQIDVNQEPAPNDFQAGGFGWEILSNVVVSGNMLTVELRDDADQFVTADAIRLLPMGHSLVSDNRGPEFTGTGSLQINAGLMSTQRVSPAGTGTTVGTWSLNGLTLPIPLFPGLYQVSATWSTVAGAASNSPFTIGNGTDSFTTLVDQSTPPDDFVQEGVSWERLGTFQVDSFFDIFVSLSDDANGSVIADAIRFEPVGEIDVLQKDPQTELWSSVGSGGLSDFGVVPRDDLSGLASSVRQFAIRNNGPGDLNLREITVTGTSFTLLTPPATDVLRRGEIVELEIELAELSLGNATGQVMIPSADFSGQLFQFELFAIVVDDDTPPTVSLTEPPTGTSVVAGPSIVISADADDDFGVRRVEFLVNGQTFTDDTAPFSIEYFFPPGQHPPTSLDVHVTAFDFSGDSGVDTGTYQIELDAPPQVQLLSPTNGANPFVEGVSLPVIVDAIDDLKIVRTDLFVNESLTLTQDGAATEFSLPQLDLNGPATVYTMVTDLHGRLTPTIPLIFIPVEPLTLTAPSYVPPFQNPPDDLLTPLFEWNPLPGATGYEIFIRNLRTQQYVVSPIVTSPEWRVLSELQQGLHRIWLRALDADGNRLPWSDSYDLMIDVPNPPSEKPAFVITTPGIDPTPEFRLLAQNQSADPRVLSTFDRVDVFIRDRTAPQQVDVILRGLTSNVIELQQGLRPDDYLVWVRQSNTAGEFGPWSDPLELTITTPALQMPVVTGPSGPQSISPPAVTWDSVNLADHFSVFIRRTDRGQPDLHETGTEGLSWTPQTALPNGDYLIWVRAISSAGVLSPWSQPVAFSINVPVPDKVILVGPAGNISTGFPIFSWQPSSHAHRYILWLTNDDTGQHPLLREPDIAETQYLHATVLPAGNYRFWIRAVNSVGVAGLWSDSQSFTVDPS